MPVTENWSYLDHAAVGPLSSPAADALRRYAGEAESQGDTVWPDWAKRTDSLRKSAAELLQAEHDEVCLIPNTSSGINLVAEGFPWQPGDSVVVPEGEFPSNLYPWQNQQSRGVELRVVPRRGERVEPDDLFDQVDSTTRMIALSWVGYATGFRVDLETIVERAHEKGVFVFLDAIQGLGIFDLDLSRIDVDFLAADGHKWLLGPEGMGIAVIRRRHLDRLRCGNVGWNSVRSPFNYTEPELKLRKSAIRFEPGSANMAGAAALAASVEMFLAVRKQHGPHAIAERILTLTDSLAEQLVEVGARPRVIEQADRRSGILTFDVPNKDPVQVRKHALDQGCVVSVRGGGIRAGVHAYNDHADLERLVRSVRDA